MAASFVAASDCKLCKSATVNFNAPGALAGFWINELRSCGVSFLARSVSFARSDGLNGVVMLGPFVAGCAREQSHTVRLAHQADSLSKKSA
jgi:hypothetical protein